MNMQHMDDYEIITEMGRMMLELQNREVVYQRTANQMLEYLIMISDEVHQLRMIRIEKGLMP